MGVSNEIPMKLQFYSVDEFDVMWEAVHAAILYWKKVRQDAQGKVCLQVDGKHTHYTEQYAIDMMVQNAQLLKEIEDTPHPEWNGSAYQMSSPSMNSAIVDKVLRMAYDDKAYGEETNDTQLD